MSQRITALCYVRRSIVRDHKDLISPKIQRQHIARVCAKNGWTPEWYEDVEGHKSAMHEKNRPGWMALKERLDAPDVVALVAYDLSRLHRKGWRIADLLTFVEQHQLRLVIADPDRQIDFSTPQGRLFAQISAIFDEWYAMDISIRRKANIAYRKSQNKTVGLPPFGTRRDKDGYLIPLDEGAWLLPGGVWKAGKVGEPPPHPDALWRGYFDCARRILEVYLHDIGYTKSCKELQAEGWAFRDRGGQPSPLEVDDIRRVTWNWVEYGGGVLDKRALNRKYAELNLDEIVLDPERAVFDIQLLRQVAEMIVKRSVTTRPTQKTEIVYPLADLIYCAHCEQLAAVQNNSRLRSRLTGKRKIAYAHRPGLYCGCSRRMLMRHVLEADFHQLILKLTIPSEQLTTIVDLATSNLNNSESVNSFEAKRTATIDRYKQRMIAARRLYEDGDLTYEEYQERKAKNKREIARWQGYTDESQKFASQMLLRAEALNKIALLWRHSSDEDRYHMAHHLFDYLVYDLDEQRFVDFRLKDWAQKLVTLIK